MFCIVAFVILAILGIFSASYRELAREAWSCVFRRVTLRPCNTGFDEKMKSRILGSVINRSETAARVLNRNFELLSWTMFVLMAVSTVYAARGLYLFYVTGNCSGLNQTRFCLLDPTGESTKVSSVGASCPITPTTVADLTLKGVDLQSFPTIKGSDKERVVLIGCYGCVYTRKVYQDLKELAQKHGNSFTFIDYPVKVSTTLMTRLGYCVNQRYPEKYWRMNELLFQANPVDLDNIALAERVTAQVGLPWSEINRCISDPASEDAVTRQMDEASKTNFFGTPTVFIDSQAFVGPKPPRVYAISMSGLLYWLR